MWHHQQQTPHHVHATGYNIDAARRLWAAKLLQLVRDAVTPDEYLSDDHSNGRSFANQFERADARRHVRDMTETFCYACAVAGMDAEAIRDAVMNWRVDVMSVTSALSAGQAGKPRAKGGRPRKALAQARQKG